MGLITAVVVTGAGLTAAVTIVPIVTALGFTAGGIAAGSTAASMMSAAAIANGGGVTSMAVGGLVAACQSIGAIGGIKAAAAVAISFGNAAIWIPTP